MRAWTKSLSRRSKCQVRAIASTRGRTPPRTGFTKEERAVQTPFQVRAAHHFGLAPLIDQDKRDLLEIMEDRFDKSATLITSQLPTKNWHAYINEPTRADAILDRLVHNAYVIDLQGESMRKKRAQ